MYQSCNSNCPDCLNLDDPLFDEDINQDCLLPKTETNTEEGDSVIKIILS